MAFKAWDSVLVEFDSGQILPGEISSDKLLWSSYLLYGASFLFINEASLCLFIRLSCVCEWSSLVFEYGALLCLCMELPCVFFIKLPCICVWSSLVFVNGTFLCSFIKLPYICMCSFIVFLY